MRRIGLESYVSLGGVSEDTGTTIMINLRKLCEENVYGTLKLNTTTLISFCALVLLPESIRILCKMELGISMEDVDVFLNYGSVVDAKRMLEGESSVLDVVTW